VPKVRKAALGVAGIALFVVVWQMVPSVGLVDPQYVPAAATVFGRLGELLGRPDFWVSVGQTLAGWFLGLTIATIAGAALGACVGLVPFLRRATHTTIEFLRPIPSVALIPLAVLMYGLDLEAALVIIVYATFWPVFIQVIYGVADVDPVARDTARAFGLNGPSRLVSLILPTALPYLMTGIRLSASVALILAVTAEMVIGNPGLGRLIGLSQSAGDAASLFALVVVTGMLGLILNLLFRLIERRSLAWHQSVRGEEVL